MSEQATTEKWNEGLSQGFIDWGAFFVPDRASQMNIISALIPDSNVRTEIVELCCGEGLLAKEILARHPHAYVHALDGSRAMLDAAARRLAEFAGRFESREFDIVSDRWRHFPRPVHAFVSSLAVHHLDALQKQKLFADMYRMLAAGGTVVLADVVLAAGSMGKAVAGAEWDRSVIEESTRIHGDARAFDHFVGERWNMYTNPLDEIDKPSTLVDQLDWLRQAGFREVDVYWMRAGHAIFGGYK